MAGVEFNQQIALPKMDVILAPYGGNLAIPMHELMYLDNALVGNTGYALPCTSMTDQGTLGANQLLFGSAFLGVSTERKLATDDTTLAGASKTVEVSPEFVGEFSCTSATWTFGDMVGIDETSAGTALSTRKVIKVTDPLKAIGYCIRKEATATTRVLCGLFSRVLPIGGFPSTSDTTGTNLSLSGNLAVTGTSGFTGDVTSGNIAATGTVAVTGGITASTTIASTGNLSGGNIATAGNLAVTGASVFTGNITSGNIAATGTAAVTGGITATTTIAATGNLSGGNIATAGNLAVTGTSGFTGDVTSGNIAATGTVAVTGGITATTTIAATGNLSGGNISTAGNLSATKDLAITGNSAVTGNATVGGTLTVTGATALNGLTSLLSGTLAAAGSAQGNAAAIITNIVAVSGATNATGVKLPAPASAKSKIIIVKNTDATNSLLVYPNSTEQIDAGGASTADNIAASASVLYYSDGTNWFSLTSA